MLYATCSIFPEENDEVVADLVASENKARQLPLPAGARPQRLPEAEHYGLDYPLMQDQD